MADLKRTNSDISWMAMCLIKWRYHIVLILTDKGPSSLSSHPSPTKYLLYRTCSPYPAFRPSSPSVFKILFDTEEVQSAKPLPKWFILDSNLGSGHAVPPPRFTHSLIFPPLFALFPLPTLYPGPSHEMWNSLPERFVMTRFVLGLVNSDVMRILLWQDGQCQCKIMPGQYDVLHEIISSTSDLLLP